MSNRILLAAISYIFMTLIASCISPRNTIVPTQTSAPLITATSTNGPLLSSPVASLTPDVTFSPVPTLSKEDAYRLLADLLKNNSDCQLPCWWGIIPGESTPLDLHEKLIPLSNIADTHLLFANSGSVDILYPRNDWLINVILSFEADDANKSVKIIIIRTQALPKKNNVDINDRYDVGEYHELLESYALDRILSIYGPPSQVLIRADKYSYTQSPETFETTLLYPEKGIFVRYNSLAERLNDKIYGCPSKAFVESWLLSPDDKDSYQAILSSRDMTWEGNFPYSRSVEDTASMTVEEFYQTFNEPTDSCLETPLNIWPEH